MSGAAMYRYFASRDELLTTLVTESYEELAETLEQVAHRARRRAPESRLRAALQGLRDWALAHPHRYRLVFGSTYGSGELDPERIIPAAHRAMGVILAAPRRARTQRRGARRRGPHSPPTARRLGRKPGGGHADPGVLLRGLAAWTRMHGILSLEIEGFFAQMGVDPARLYKVEIDGLLAESAASR